VPEDLRARRPEALSAAHLMEARAHLRAARYRAAAVSLARAARLRPSSIDLAAARLLAHGVVHHRRAAFRPGAADDDGPTTLSVATRTQIPASTRRRALLPEPRRGAARTRPPPGR
jgi:hypothetical protein